MRTILVILLLSCVLASNAQTYGVKSVKSVKPEISGRYMISGTVPGTRYLLVTGEGYKGLSLLDYSNGKMKKISSDNGAGYEPAVTGDATSVIFRSDYFSENRKYSSLSTYHIKTGKTITLIDREREVQPAVVSGNMVLIKTGKGSHIQQAGTTVTKSAGDDVFITIEDLFPVLYSEGQRNVLRPNGDGFYIWASLSPDRKKILYNYQGLNTYICDLSGSIMYNAGRINAPRWLNDNVVIGMDDKDDGQRVVSSEIVYYSLREGERRYLTATGSRSEMFPWPLAGGRKIAFTTDKGEIFVLKLRSR